LFNKFVKNKVKNKRLKHKYKVLIRFHIWIVFIIHIYLILNISLTIINLSYIRKIMFWDSNSTNSMLWWWTCLLVSYLCYALYTYYIAPTPKLKVCLVSDTNKCNYIQLFNFIKLLCVIVWLCECYIVYSIFFYCFDTVTIVLLQLLTFIEVVSIVHSKSVSVAVKKYATEALNHALN
jgi:hypothetical protein